MRHEEAAAGESDDDSVQGDVNAGKKKLVKGGVHSIRCDAMRNDPLYLKHFDGTLFSVYTNTTSITMSIRCG